MEIPDDLALPQRVVLLGLVSLDEDGETPAPVNVVMRRCQEFTDSIEDIGKLTEAEVGRGLNRLEAEGLVEVPSMEETSPVGKGRPAYELAADADAVADALAADERLADHVRSLELA